MSLEQNEPRSVKTSAGKRWRRVVIWVVALPALLFVAVLLGWYGCRPEPNGSKPPAPDAPEAQQWEPEAKEPTHPDERSPDTPSPDTSSPDAPSPDTSAPNTTPDAWNLPLEIVFDNIPEIPEEIRGPSPPIEEEGEVEDR